MTRFILAVVLLSCLSVACTPLIIEDGVIGLGCFDFTKREVSEHSHVAEISGIGLLIFPDRLAIGITDAELLFSSQEEENLCVNFGETELFLGDAAEREALLMTQESTKEGTESPCTQY